MGSAAPMIIAHEDTGFGRYGGVAKTQFQFTTLHWIAISLSAIYGVALVNHGLVPSMEPRFAEVVREMIASGQWLIPVKNGVPYVEYPPLYYWLAIVGKQLGLPMLVAIRLPSYVALIAWVLLLGRWQKFIAPDWPDYAYALVGAALPLLLFQFGIAQTDGLLVLGTLLAFYGYAAHKIDPVTQHFPWWLWAGVALATAAKGPVGLACTLPVFVLDTCWGCNLGADSGHRPRLKSVLAELLRLAWLRGLLLVLLVTVPWYIAAGTYHGWNFVHALLIDQNFDRYIVGYSHPQPWWYYLKTISYDFFPLSLLLPVGLAQAFRRRKEFGPRLVLTWAIFTVLFFSISGSKQGKYLLPVAPALVGLSFIALDGFASPIRSRGWQMLRIYSVSIIVVWAMLVVLVLPFLSPNIGGVAGFASIRQQIEKSPGQLVHFQWPRSLTLYELGAPMAYVRSSRELYQKIHNGEILAGDYVLAKRSELGYSTGDSQAMQLVPYPNSEYFEIVLETEIDKPAVLLRIRDDARFKPIPETPEPRRLSWREQHFDTD